MISEKEVEKIAFLSRLEINDIERKKYQEQLSDILKYIDSLKEVNCSDLDYLGLDSGVSNQYRNDEVKRWDQEGVDTALKQFSDEEEGQLKINRVL
jgi:aspartyl-tRNA(Asn)/glutamyl-tRNA(Gln) amidotransferase subunit C